EFPDLEGSTYAGSLVIGKPLGIRKLYEYTGIDPETGIYTFRDFNGDGEITASEDRQSLKDVSPEYYGGIGSKLNYKAWELDFQVQFVKQLGRNYLYTSAMAGTFSNLPAGMLDHWPSGGEDAVVQGYTS